MNIPILRRVQLSISDTSVPFDMGDWDCCIAAHAMRVTHYATREPDWDSPRYVLGHIQYAAGQEILGLTDTQANQLFYGGFRTRAEAIQAIDALIIGETFGAQSPRNGEGAQSPRDAPLSHHSEHSESHSESHPESAVGCAEELLAV